MSNVTHPWDLWMEAPGSAINTAYTPGSSRPHSVSVQGWAMDGRQMAGRMPNEGLKAITPGAWGHS